MSKKAKENSLDLYYMNNNGQAKVDSIEEAMKKKKMKERDKRIKENMQKANDEEVDMDTEILIQMTNKNGLKRDEVKRRELTRIEKKRKKRNKKIKFFLKSTLFLGFIIGTTVFAMTSPIFNIMQIDVKNNDNVSRDTIISSSEIRIEQNILKFKKMDTIKKIEENSYIEEAKISRKFPNKIEITVEERIASYNVDFMGKYMKINIQGYMLEVVDENEDLLVIIGANTNEEEFIPNNRLNKEDLEKLEDVIRIMKVMEDNELGSKVTSINISKKDDYVLNIEEEQKKVHIGNSSNLSSKILYILSIIEKEKGKTGDIYINGDNNSKFQTYFREKY